LVYHYPDTVTAKLPRGWRDRLLKLAKEADRPLGPYLRDLIRRHLESADRAERRRKQAECGS
jgi:predicted DNA-binding protein